MYLDPVHDQLHMFSLDLTKDVWRDKYRWDGNPYELTPYDTLDRVANGVYAKDPSERAHADARRAMELGLWCPGGRILAGAGTDKVVTLFNCYVMNTIHDSMHFIKDVLGDSMLTMQQGGGIGMDFSTLRPTGAWLARTQAVASGPLPFMDMWDSMCNTIMSAGSRRGAMMGVMHCEHPDLPAFIEAKQQAGRLTNFNISVLITDAFMDAVTNDEYWYLGFPVPRADGQHLFVVEHDDGSDWYVYSCWKARDLWEKIMESTYEYAEPGVIFIDRVNDYNPLNYCEEIRATNPCVTGDTRILTDQGHLPIGPLVGQKVWVWNGEQFSPVVPFSTGVNPLLEVTFSNGASLRATHYHRWKLADGSIVETRDLKEGTELVKGFEMPHIEGDEEPEYDAYSLGFWEGDGSINADASNLYKHNQGIKDRLVGAVWQGESHCKWNHPWNLPTKGYVPVNATATYCIDWLAGYLDADGCVEYKGKHSKVLTCCSKDRKFLDDLRLMLSRLGVTARVWERSDAGDKVASGTGKSYWCNSTANLMINHKGAHQLVAQGLVCERLDLSTFSRKPEGRANRGVKVKCVREVPAEETYCFTEPKRHMGVFEGVPAQQCGEQPLPPYGCCNLGSVNLARMVYNPFTKDAYIDYDLIDKVTRIGTRFLDNVIDVTGYPLDGQEAEEENKRRIGLGITGLGDALMELRIHYGSERALQTTDKIMQQIRNSAFSESARLAQERGVFPLYDAEQWGKDSPVVQSLPMDVKKEIEQFGMRNGTVLTIAPTGTTSVFMGNVSSGLEPVFGHYFYRKVLQPNGEHEEYLATDYAYNLYCQVTGTQPEAHKLPTYMTTALQLSVENHVRMQAVCQRHVDSSISKTINCPKDMPFEDFKLVYWDTYTGGCKGCTTYRPSDVRGSVLSTESTENSGSPDAQGKQHNGEVRSRPQVLAGKTYKLSWPQSPSSYYVTINDDVETGRPFEMFITSTNSQYQDWTTALSLMISAIMRKGGDISFIPEELEKVVSVTDFAWMKGKFYGSLVALVGETIRTHLQYESEPREGDQLPTGEVEGEVEPQLGGMCKSCGQPTVVMKEGCKTCLNCGDSQCG